ncbi:MAG: NAD(+) synthase [Desulfovibrio sp.]|jgi:NAD+ synthetase|nr:NAD(+) synthase [Desulfovibrio sp.]
MNNQLPAVTLSPLAADVVWEKMVSGVRDFVRAHGRGTALTGISGGVDSALVTAAAVEALGAANVLGVLMPSPYTTQESVDAATDLALELDIRTLTIPIAPVMEAFDEALAPAFAGREADVTEDNLQARIRATLLMALSNKFGYLLLNTGNKSEGSVGYCTLYGDSCGALAVIGDLYKGEVYALCRRLNERKGRFRIPEIILTRAPSAELYSGQKDEDALPPYGVLDPILADHLERGMEEAALRAAGHDADTVRRVLELVRGSAFKRAQGPPALRLRNLIPLAG